MLPNPAFERDSPEAGEPLNFTLDVNSMRLVITITILFTSFGVFADNLFLVRGEVKLSESGIGIISECGTNRIFQFGVMASSPYFKFIQKFENLSAGAKYPVLIEVEGNLVQAGSNMSSIESPRVIAISRGGCD